MPDLTRFVLTRRTGQRIEMSNGVIIEFYKVSGRSASVRITAPHDVRIVRGELADEWRAKWAAEDAAKEANHASAGSVLGPGADQPGAALGGVSDGRSV